MGRLTYLLFFAAFSLAACETAVDIALPEEEPRLVINSLFHADSLWAVEVSTSRGVLSSEDPEPILSAAVEILENGTVVETLIPERTSGLYRSRRHRPQVGGTYAIRASAPGFPPAEATASVPEPQPFSIETRRLQPRDTDYPDFQEYEVTVTFSDPGGAANYYALGLYSLIEANGSDGPVRAYSSIGFSSGDAVLRENRLVDDDLFEVDGDPFYDRAYFSDALIDGQTYALKIRTSSYYDGPDEPGVERRQLRRDRVAIQRLLRIPPHARAFGLHGREPFCRAGLGVLERPERLRHLCRLHHLDGAPPLRYG